MEVYEPSLNVLHNKIKIHDLFIESYIYDILKIFTSGDFFVNLIDFKCMCSFLKTNCCQCLEKNSSKEACIIEFNLLSDDRAVISIITNLEFNRRKILRVYTSNNDVFIDVVDDKLVIWLNNGIFFNIENIQLKSAAINIFFNYITFHRIIQ